MGTLWLVLLLGCVVWYGTVTLYVAWRGVKDIRTMLAHLRREAPGPDTPGTR